ncbi:hypothetical protein [Nonomuraea salmonea]
MTVGPACCSSGTPAPPGTRAACFPADEDANATALTGWAPAPADPAR